MADGNYGERIIYIDLTVTGARIIRAYPVNWVKINAIRINGVAGAGGSGTITLRQEGASGAIIFQEAAPAGQSFDGTMVQSTWPPVVNGLYMDDPGTAWQTVGGVASHMMIYTV